MGNGAMAKGPQATAPILDSTKADISRPSYAGQPLDKPIFRYCTEPSRELERFAKSYQAFRRPGALGTLGERFSDARPVSQRVFMSGHELDGELRVARAAQRLDALLDLGLACRKRGGAD